MRAMVSERERILELVRAAVKAHPVCWMDERVWSADLPERDWTVEVFGVPLEEERDLYARLVDLKRDVRSQFGKTLTFLLRSPEARGTVEREREYILGRVRDVVGERPVRWMEPRISMGDIPGRDWLINIFDMPIEDRDLLLRLFELKGEIRAKLGRTVTFMPHSRENTDRHYAWVRTEA